VQNPLAGGAPSEDKEAEEDMTTNGGQEAPLVEPNSPPVSTPPQSPPWAPYGDNEEGEDTTANRKQEAPLGEPNSPLVSTPPLSVATPSSPAGTSPPLERGQRTRRPPAYLKDFVCDHITSGGYKSLAGCCTKKLAAKRGSCEHHENINFCEGEVYRWNYYSRGT